MIGCSPPLSLSKGFRKNLRLAPNFGRPGPWTYRARPTLAFESTPLIGRSAHPPPFFFSRLGCLLRPPPQNVCGQYPHPACEPFSEFCSYLLHLAIFSLSPPLHSHFSKLSLLLIPFFCRVPDYFRKPCFPLPPSALSPFLF